MTRTGFIALVSVIALLDSAAYAAENKDKNESMVAMQAASFPRVPLGDILDAVSKNSGKTFLVESRVPPTVVVGQPRAKDITFPMLLKVLRNNGLAAVSAGDTTSIIPVKTVRQYPLPLLFEDSDAIDDEEWVTRVIHLKKANVKQMVPILRPLLPQPGHLAAHSESNTLVIVDRNANARRVARMILAIETSTPEQNQ